ncbi:MAG: hypothetical protein KJ905_01195 [Nanoarchaeota archaeon]|nr:hypothetical protein [Nanoarchaeota archaeon]MBU1501375.1 hypothetical protein [Nanoarchaeota archaeon]
MKRGDKKKFNQIVKDIKSIKIQGARNIAEAAVKAYSLFPSKTSKKVLLESRPTEPMMQYALSLAESGESLNKILEHLKDSQDRINNQSLKLIKSNDRIFTHCHSSSVSNALVYAKKKRKKFQVYNTETRPLYQGRKTARELSKAGIKVTMFLDSAAAFAIEKQNSKDKIFANKIFLGADALLSEGIINKIGSYQIAELAHYNKIPVYIFADSWKFTSKKVPIEQRSINEVWNKALKNVKIKNPAFEFVPKKYIKGIVSEFGIQKYSDFVKKCRKRK